jgi:glucokinase
MISRKDTPLTIGVDLGGTKLAAALVTEDGQVLHDVRRPSEPAKGGEQIVLAIAEAARILTDVAGDREVVGIGVGVAGQVDPETGAVRHAPNLHWSDFPLKANLEDAVNLPVAVLNDVQAATYGEWVHGAGHGADDLVCMFVGTGVGGGVIANGELVRGYGGSAGEVGHITVDLHGPPCRCGNRGCVEAYAGGWAIAERARGAVREDPRLGAALLALEGGDIDLIAAHTVARAAQAGDELAHRLVLETGEALGAGAAAIVNGFNPCLLVLGGGVIEGIPQLLPIVDEVMRRRALRAAVEALRIVPPRLGSHAGAIGAATWILRQLGRSGDI